MKPAGYTPEQLRNHRASHFVFGGTHEERRAWAEDSADLFEGEGPLGMLQLAAQLPALLVRTRGVVFVPDVLSLEWEAQSRIVHCLHNQEERAKWVLGLTAPPDRAVQSGALRPDLWFRLRHAQVDVSTPEAQTLLRQRKTRLSRGAASSKAQKR